MRFVHWLMGLAVVGVCGVGTFWLLAPGEADRLRQEKEAMARRQVELQRVIERLTGQERVAEIHIVDQIRRGDVVNNQPAPNDVTTILFTEIDRQGHALPTQRFVVNDIVIAFDALVIQFDQSYVAAGDSLRGKSLALFRRIYGEHQQPAQAWFIDPAGDVPNVYRVDPEPSDFEKTLWAQFWNYAIDPKLAARDGVRVAQGQAVYTEMRRGQVWTLSLQNNGGLLLELRRWQDRKTTQPSRASS